MNTFHTATYGQIYCWKACYCINQHGYSSALFIHFGWCWQQTRKLYFSPQNLLMPLPRLSQLWFPQHGCTRFSSVAFKACWSNICGICRGMWWLPSVPFWQRNTWGICTQMIRSTLMLRNEASVSTQERFKCVARRPKVPMKNEKKKKIHSKTEQTL